MQVIFDHDSIASLIRELNRNSQLRMICGFQPHIYSVLIDEKNEYGRKKWEMRYKLAPTASAYAKSKIESGIKKGFSRHFA